MCCKLKVLGVRFWVLGFFTAKNAKFANSPPLEGCPKGGVVNFWLILPPNNHAVECLKTFNYGYLIFMYFVIY